MGDEELNELADRMEKDPPGTYSERQMNIVNRQVEIRDLQRTNKLASLKRHYSEAELTVKERQYRDKLKSLTDEQLSKEKTTPSNFDDIKTKLINEEEDRRRLERRKKVEERIRSQGPSDTPSVGYISHTLSRPSTRESISDVLPSPPPRPSTAQYGEFVKKLSGYDLEIERNKLQLEERKKPSLGVEIRLAEIAREKANRELEIVRNRKANLPTIQETSFISPTDAKSFATSLPDIIEDRDKRIKEWLKPQPLPELEKALSNVKIAEKANFGSYESNKIRALKSSIQASIVTRPTTPRYRVVEMEQNMVYDFIKDITKSPGLKISRRLATRMGFLNNFKVSIDRTDSNIREIKYRPYSIKSRGLRNKEIVLARYDGMKEAYFYSKDAYKGPAGNTNVDRFLNVVRNLHERSVKVLEDASKQNILRDEPVSTILEEDPSIIVVHKSPSVDIKRVSDKAPLPPIPDPIKPDTVTTSPEFKEMVEDLTPKEKTAIETTVIRSPKSLEKFSEMSPEELLSESEKIISETETIRTSEISPESSITSEQQSTIVDMTKDLTRRQGTTIENIVREDPSRINTLEQKSKVDLEQIADELDQMADELDNTSNDASSIQSSESFSEFLETVQRNISEGKTTVVVDDGSVLFNGLDAIEQKELLGCIKPVGENIIEKERLEYLELTLKSFQDKLSGSGAITSTRLNAVDTAIRLIEDRMVVEKTVYEQQNDILRNQWLAEELRGGVKESTRSTINNATYLNRDERETIQIALNEPTIENVDAANLAMDVVTRFNPDNEEVETELNQVRENIAEIVEERQREQVEDSTITRIARRVLRFIRDNSVSLTGALISLAGLITALVVSARTAIIKGAQATTKLGRAIVNLGKKLWPVIGPVFSIIGNAILAGAKGLAFLARNLWILVLAAAWFIYDYLKNRK